MVQTDCVQSAYVAQTGLKLKEILLLPPPPKCWDHRLATLHLVNHFILMSAWAVVRAKAQKCDLSLQSFSIDKDPGLYTFS